MPDLSERPLGLEFLFNGEPVGRVVLSAKRLDENGIGLARDSGERKKESVIDAVFEIRASRTWQPCSTNAESSDDRELSIAVCNVEVFLGEFVVAALRLLPVQSILSTTN